MPLICPNAGVNINGKFKCEEKEKLKGWVKEQIDVCIDALGVKRETITDNEAERYLGKLETLLIIREKL